MKNLNKKWQTSLYAVLVFVFLTGQAWAVTLSFDPFASDIYVGDSIDIDIIISDLTNDNLSGFDFNINYNDSILAFDSYTLGTELDDQFMGPGLELSFGDLGFGIIHLAETSWSWDFSSQPDSFTLATISFTGISGGHSDLLFSNVVLSDDSWPAGSLDATLGTGSINVAPVPEPATMLLFATGLAGLAGLRKRTRK